MADFYQSNHSIGFCFFEAGYLSVSYHLSSMNTNRSLLFALLILFSCRHSETPQDLTVTYQESARDFPNPERGFYHPSDTRASAFEALSEEKLKEYRNPSRTANATYDVVSTLIYRDFVLDKFKSSPIDEATLTSIGGDFNTVRKAGLKMIVRFTYTLETKAGSCPDKAICPPYGDAPKNIVLGHIGQLKPLLQQHADVIAFVQMGFIGIWGENYYTDYFGDASANSKDGKLLDQNWQDRAEVLKALLDATPKEIMVQVRTPQTKQRQVYGVNSAVTSAPLTDAEAFTGSDKSRIGFHNDCFISSPDDYGTYDDYGNSSTPHKSETTALKSYFAADSKYVVVGGETCSDDYSPQNDCAPAGIAEKEMRDMHYTYLNTSYNNNVNNDWVDGGCMDNIKKNLGYRFVLRSAVLPSTISKDEPLKIKITLENTGYASPVNARPVQLILRSTTDKKTYALAVDTDVRKWYSGETVLDTSVSPGTASIPAGTYELLLSLPDAHASIAQRPEYAIRLANNDIWESETGYNKLNHRIEIR